MWVLGSSASSSGIGGGFRCWRRHEVTTENPPRREMLSIGGSNVTHNPQYGGGCGGPPLVVLG